MPLRTFTQPAVRAVGDPDPAGDMNNANKALTELGGWSSVLSTAYAGGADPTGVLDSAPAFAAAKTDAIATGRPMRVPSGTYKILSALNWKAAGLWVQGDGAQTTKILQYTANTPVAMVAGQQQIISGLTLGYASQQANTSTNAIPLQFGDDTVGNCFESRFSDLVLFQGAYGMRINPALTATAGIFSCTLENIRILGWSIRPIDLNAAAGTGASNCTGCVFSNIYCHNNNTGSPADSLLAPVFLQQWDEVVFNQLNVEHSNVFNTDVIQLQGVGNAVFNSLHLEALQLSGSSGNAGYFAIGSNTSVVVNGMSVRFSTLTGSTDNPVARFFGHDSKLTLTGLNEPSDVTVGGGGVHPWADFGSQVNCGMRVSGVLAAQVNSNQLNPATGCWLQLGDTPLDLAQAPAGAVAETFPRRFASTVSTPALTSGTLYVTLIKLAKGAVISNLTMYANTTVKTGGTHGWYVLLDSARKVLAVTADQTDAATVWGTASTPYPLPVTAPILAPYDGYYYVGVMVAATGMPTFTCAAVPAVGINGGSPILAASSSAAQTTPPAVGATMGALTSVSGAQFYAYAS